MNFNKCVHEGLDPHILCVCVGVRVGVGACVSVSQDKT